MPSPDLSALTAWITTAAVQWPDTLPERLAEHAHVARRTALQLLRRLVALQWIEESGPAARPIFRPGLLRQVVQRYALPAADEATVWARDFAPCLDVSPRVARLAHHTFCELFDNAVSHSGATTVVVSVRQTPQQLQLLVSDSGCGLFEKLRTDFGLDDPATAMLELGKGKLTSQPDAHCGRGLFFASRMADVFDLHANGGSFQHRSWLPDAWHVGRRLPIDGTSIYAAFSLDTPRSVDSVLATYSLDGTGLAFERTVVPVKLLVSDRQGLESRAQARLVCARLDQFRQADIDFNGIDEIGHGFVDEMFRVQSRGMACRLTPINMAPRVLAMVQSGAMAAASRTATALSPIG